MGGGRGADSTCTRLWSEAVEGEGPGHYGDSERINQRKCVKQRVQRVTSPGPEWRAQHGQPASSAKGSMCSVSVRSDDDKGYHATTKKRGSAVQRSKGCCGGDLRGASHCHRFRRKPKRRRWTRDRRPRESGARRSPHLETTKTDDAKNVQFYGIEQQHRRPCGVQAGSQTQPGHCVSGWSRGSHRRCPSSREARCDGGNAKPNPAFT